MCSVMKGIPLTKDFANGGVSFWYRQIGLPARRPALPGPRDYDVAIVGGGYTGLWTAYYLKRAEPGLRIAILEKEFAGFGASGRNGGWLSAEFAGSRKRHARARGRQAMIDLQRAMFRSVNEVIEVARAEGIDADVHKGGLIHVATNPAQRRRLRAGVADLRAWGYGADDVWLMERDEARERLQVAGALEASYSPHCARIQPAKLAVGLAGVVEQLGVDIFEDTTVTEILPRGATGPSGQNDHGGRGGKAAAVTTRGVVTADYVIRATEGFTASLTGQHRQWLPMNSSMIVTEPLPPDVWKHIGWHGSELLEDEAHAYVYAQRTADDRIAIGGRGVPYRYGSRTDHRGATQAQTVALLWRMLVKLFPAAADARIAHAWCGVLGVPRDWCSTVHLDHASGLGWAGGYVGSGVTTANLAGRTLRDLVLARDTALTSLPWVGRQVRQWEPEPLRWTGVQLIYTLFRAADRHENERGTTTSAYAHLANLISGR